MSKNIYIPEDRTVWCLMRLLIGLVVENYHHLHILSFFSENILLYSDISLRKVLFYVLLIKSFKRIFCCILRVSVNKVFLGFVLVLQRNPPHLILH